MDAKLTISVDEQPCPVEGMDERIIMWSRCRKCRVTTPFIPMSEETWKYSLGKYLELSFYHLNICSRSHDCDHDIFNDFTRFFALGGSTIRIEKDPIKIYEISAPAMRKKADPEVMAKLRLQEQSSIQTQITEFFNSVLDRIDQFTYDICPPDKITQCKEILTDLSKKAKVDKKLMLQLLHQTQITALSTDYFAISSFYKVFLESVRNWDTEFSNFIQNNLQTDAKDIRRRTAAQLKRMFVERDTVPDRSTVFSADVAKVEVDQFAIDKQHLPSLNNLNQNNNSSETFTNALKRAISVRYGVPRNMVFPSLLPSPSHHDNSMELAKRRPSHELQSLHLTNSRSRIIFEETQAEVESAPRISFHSHESVEPNLAEISELVADTDHWMYPRYTHIQQPSIKSPQEALKDSIDAELSVDHSVAQVLVSPNRGDLNEEGSNAEMNTITGVTAESDTLPRRAQDTFNNNGDNRPTSIMQTITNLWTGNPANFIPLVYPNGPGDHVFANSNVIVRESEPTSIVAFSLCSPHYLEQLDVIKSESSVDRLLEKSKSFYGDHGERDETNLKEGGNHIRYQFWDGATKMHCKIYFAEQFHTLRQNCGIDDVYDFSLARCVKWEASGGKSGSTFLKTLDDRFVVKKITQTELEELIDFSPFYFEYMSKACFQKVIRFE